jgi:hypothetical protein
MSMIGQINRGATNRPLVLTEAKPLFEADIQTEVIWVTKGIRRTNELPMIVYGVEWKACVVLEEITEQKLPDPAGMSIPGTPADSARPRRVLQAAAD